MRAFLFKTLPPMYTTNKKFMLFYCSVLAAIVAVITLVAANHKPRYGYEYHLRLEIDSAYIYSSNDTLVGVAAYGIDGIDSVINKDNE